VAGLRSPWLRMAARHCRQPLCCAREARGGTPGRVWFLSATDRGQEWVLKLDASPREHRLLVLLSAAGIGVPRPVAQLRPPCPEEPPVSQGAARDALLLQPLPGASLREHIEAGEAPPLGSLARALASVHAPRVADAVTAAGALGCPAPPLSPAARAESLAARCGGVFGPRPRVDLAPVLTQALAELPRWAERATAARAAPVLCHGAPTLENAIVLRPEPGSTAAGAVALVDWEHAYLGAAEGDAAAVGRVLFAAGWSGLAALAAAEGMARGEPSPIHPARLGFALLATAVEALLETGSGRAGSGGPMPSEPWAAFLALTLARVGRYAG
jgi:hypothetical protein